VEWLWRRQRKKELLDLWATSRKEEKKSRGQNEKGERRKECESQATEAGTLGGLVAGGQHA